jgi:hypothetical protein
MDRRDSEPQQIEALGRDGELGAHPPACLTVNATFACRTGVTENVAGRDRLVATADCELGSGFFTWIDIDIISGAWLQDI